MRDSNDKFKIVRARKGVAEGSAADGSVNYTLGHTPDAEYVYSIYRDGKKEGTYHSVDQAREIMGNMKRTSPNREYKIKRGARNKMAGPAGQLPEQDMAEGAMDDKIAKHNAAVAKLPGGQAHRSNHPNLLKSAPKGYSFSVSHKLVPDQQGVSEGSDRIAANKQDRVEALENKLKAKGYARTKDSDGGEYQYRWTRDGAPSYVVNYRSGANGYAEFWKEQGVDEAYNFKGSFPFDVDHMGGTRGINLPSAPTKKFFTDKKQWSQTVDDINSSKYDDNSEYSGTTGRTTVSIDNREWARWSDAQEKGYIEMSSMTEQDISEDDDAVAAFLARGGEIQQLKPQSGPKRSGVAFASKHIGSAGGRGNTKGKVSGLGANTGKASKPVVTAEQHMAEDALAGMKRLAGIAPAQTQTTPGQRQYRHMPTAVQPR
jgi:hypothetical protein